MMKKQDKGTYQKYTPLNWHRFRNIFRIRFRIFYQRFELSQCVFVSQCFIINLINYLTGLNHFSWSSHALFDSHCFRLIGDPGMTSYRWPDFGAVDNKPRKQQQTIQRSAMIYGLSWTAFIIMCIIAVLTSIDTWVWSWCRTCIKKSFTKLVGEIKSRNCWRWAGENVRFSERLICALRVRAANGNDQILRGETWHLW